MQIMGIQIWGDSVLKGVIFDTLRNRYVLLKENAVSLISGTLNTPVVNHSRMGRTAPEGLIALNEEPREAIENRLIVLEYGGNDCDFDWAQVAKNPGFSHVPHTSAEQFVASLEDMVLLVRDKGGLPLLCTLPPLDHVRYLKWITRDGLREERIMSFLGTPERIYRWQEYYNALILRVAAKLDCACLPIREMFLEKVRGENVLCEDGIHPNAAGHKIIAQAAIDFANQFARQDHFDPVYV